MLTLKQRKFIDAYLGEANGNATRAAILAGYASPSVEAHRLLRNANIREEIDRLYRESAMSPEEAIRRLADQARGAGAYMSVQDGRVVVDVEALLKDGLGHLIKSVKMGKYGQEIEFHDAQAALFQIGRHLKLFVDRQEITTNAETAAAIAEAASALHRRLAALTERIEETSVAAETDSDREGGAQLGLDVLGAS